MFLKVLVFASAEIKIALENKEVITPNIKKHVCGLIQDIPIFPRKFHVCQRLLSLRVLQKMFLQFQFHALLTQLVTGANRHWKNKQLCKNIYGLKSYVI